MTQAFETMTAKQEDPQQLQQQQFRPTSPSPSSLSRPQSVMSRDPNDYVAAHRTLSMNRDTSRSVPKNHRRRSSFMSSGGNEPVGGFYPNSEGGSERHHVHRRKSIFQKVKDFFSLSDLPDENEYDDERGRYYEEDGFKARMRRRSRSVAKFLGLSNREE